MIINVATVMQQTADTG